LLALLYFCCLKILKPIIKF